MSNPRHNLGRLEKRGSARGICGVLMLILVAGPVSAADFIAVAKDAKGFVRGTEPFSPHGFNYDHDRNGRLLEDYWADEWPLVERHFKEMHDLGANVVRIHLQLGKFMTAADQPDEANLKRLGKLLALAEQNKLALDVTGLGCYHKADVPAWYDSLAESDRWDVQARFWSAVATVCKDSPAVFCYDLMNEPVSPGGKRKDGDWLGPAFGGKHFVQMIALDQKDRPRPDIAQAWIKHLAAAIRKVDRRHLITVGLVDWSLDRKGLTSGFVPDKVAGDLDFVCVHLYPESKKLDEAFDTLKAFNVGKPVVVEETFPLKCSTTELLAFMERSRGHAAGWISFYWGRPDGKTLGDAIQREWLEKFTIRAEEPVAKVVPFHGYKKAIEMKLGKARAVLCPEAGGRVLVLSIDGQDALWLDDAEKNWEPGKPNPSSAGRFDYGPELTVAAHPKIWGGEWTVEITGGAVKLTSPAEDAAGMQLTREFKFVTQGKNVGLACKQTMINIGKESREVCHWGRSFSPGGGICVVPLGDRPSRFPSKYAMYEDGAIINVKNTDDLIRERDGCLEVLAPPRKPKLGFDSYAGWLGYAMPNKTLFVKRFATHPDRVYNEAAGLTLSVWYPSGPRIELEPIGPRERLKAGQSASFTETWWLLPHPYPKAGEKLDLKALREQVEKETVKGK